MRRSREQARDDDPSGFIHPLARTRLNAAAVLLLGEDALLVVVAAVGVLAVSADALAELPEEEGDGAAGEADAEEDGAGPLVAEVVVHLAGEEDDAGAPDGADEGLGGEGRGRAVLVRVHQVVVGAVVDEDEAEAHGEAGERGPDPHQPVVRRPREHGQPDRDEPAREHHRDEP